MTKNVLQKTSGLLVIQTYVPDQPGYSGGSVPQPRQNDYQIPPISYDPTTTLFNVGGLVFNTYESVTGYVMTSLWQQQQDPTNGLRMGYGYSQGFFVFGIEKAQDPEVVANTVEIAEEWTNPFVAEIKESGKVATYSRFTNVQPVTYHGPAMVYHRPAMVYHRPAMVYHRPAMVYHVPAGRLYHPPQPYGVDMRSYMETQFKKSVLYNG